MSEAPVPTVYAALRDFSYAPRGGWYAGTTAPDEPVDLAEELHLASKVSAVFPAQSLGPAGRQLALDEQAPFALGRKALAFAGPRVALPAPQPLPVELREVIHRRRSLLPAECGSLELDALGTVLGLCAGSSPDRPGLRVIPSGGAMYPLDVVVVAHAVDGLPRGAYVYDPIGHALLPRGAVDPVQFHQRAISAAPPPQPAATLAVVATFARTRAKYGLRGYRFALLEAGHLVQAAITVATALGLAALPWGGFVDAAVEEQLELDGLERSCLYLLPLSAQAEGGAGDGAA